MKQRLRLAVRRALMLALTLTLTLMLTLASGAARANIIVLASSDKGAVAEAIRAIRAVHGERMTVHNLGASREREDQIIQAIKASPVQQVVAVGLLAAQVARQRLDSKQVVFCQVLNVEEFDLVAPWMKGVSAMPSLNKQFALWKSLDPGLRKIGLITGAYAAYMLAEAKTAASALGLEIVHVEVSSERAVLAALQELRERGIDGLWLAPDSSILSRRAIDDVMTFSVKHHVQVLAFSPALLREGALLGASADTREIARLALERVRRASMVDGSVPGRSLTPLSGARISISAAAAARFGLLIAPKMKDQANVE